MIGESYIVTQVAKRTRVKKRTVQVVYEEIMKEIMDCLANGDEIGIPGLGKFLLIEKPEMVMYNYFGLNKKLIVPAHYRLGFKPSKILKEKIKKLKIIE